jgi:hypothetical protein
MKQKEFVPSGHMVNKECNVEVVYHLVQRICQVTFKKKSLHCTTIGVVVSTKGISELSQHPYSPYLSPPDFFLISKNQVYTEMEKM